MKRNITLSAEEAVIRQARRLASAESRTLNELFRQWLEQYVQRPACAGGYDALMERLDYARAGRSYSREEMNERR